MGMIVDRPRGLEYEGREFDPEACTWIRRPNFVRKRDHAMGKKYCLKLSHTWGWPLLQEAIFGSCQDTLWSSFIFLELLKHNCWTQGIKNTYIHSVTVRIGSGSDRIENNFERSGSDQKCCRKIVPDPDPKHVICILSEATILPDRKRSVIICIIFLIWFERIASEICGQL